MGADGWDVCTVSVIYSREFMAQVVRYSRYTLFVNIYYQRFTHVRGTGNEERIQFNFKSKTPHADTSCIFDVVSVRSWFEKFHVRTVV